MNLSGHSGDNSCINRLQVFRKPRNKIWGELTFEEIAAQLELPANTAASRYRYALGALRKELNATACHG